MQFFNNDLAPVESKIKKDHFKVINKKRIYTAVACCGCTWSSLEELATTAWFPNILIMIFDFTKIHNFES